MRIVCITDDFIGFDTLDKISFKHEQDCCEHNYADFSVIKNHIFIHHDFDRNLKFEFVNELGFTFGDDDIKIFVPCYSEQNGYYSTDLDILFNDKVVCSGYCKEDLY